MAKKRTTIADIARILEVSMHTVNKALYGKKGVGDELRAKILRTAKKMNYRANRVAQSMARKPMIIGVIAHSKVWDGVGKPFMVGIQAAIEQLRDYNTFGKYYYYPSPRKRTMSAMQAVRDGVSVVVCLHFVPTDQEAACWSEAGIPFALLGTDGLKDRRLTCVRSDAVMAGRLVAQLFAMALPAEATVVAFTGSMGYLDHTDKITGFTQEMVSRGRRVARIYEHGDDPIVATERTDEAFSTYPNLAGIYISTGVGIAICNQVLARKRHPLMIGTDLYPEMKTYLQQGMVAATVYQNMIDQGRKLIEMLYANLCENQPIDREVFIPPSVVLPANMSTFLT